ncbi:hypothetical protein [Haloarcula salina]|uniref:Uncharacterized protein n=1 Tax=Haloarcula salina TaxID=1429914 RepID=A0AA41G0F1_9EURY|nr:hypothetical protein [Haloarcula salina]MBV0902117.1 hypothetical protein [Haloarcula salina]
MSSGIPLLTPLARWLETVMFGDYERQYRLFTQAVVAVAAGLVLAYGLTALGVIDVGPGGQSVLGTAASVAVTAFVIVGVLQFLVLANVLERTNEDVATKAAELEQAAEQLEETATELETTVDTVEDAANTVDEAAADVEQTAEQAGDPDAAEQVTEAKDKTKDAKERAESVQREVKSAKEKASEVEETATEVEETVPAENERDGEDGD